ncbi:UPF0545 protein C22orf39 homolog [Phlebotomus argentipes]|uniref:UPF0545 protein C22orf39 homolog n=1 Tax=Phlebotomus argentipes TaxID=94469 RepID=UPI002892F116|nr:UPF0545 protein C22orf39 homolog [Phlebotomus argentipes]
MSGNEQSSTFSSQLSDERVRDNLMWASRPCFLYKHEFSDCKSYKARFNQYFIYGESIDCSQWGKDYEDCLKYEEKDDLAAARRLLDSEAERRQKRMEAHKANDVWKKRSTPPTDWNAPLPEWFTKTNENTFLALKSKELQDGVETPAKESSFCSVM